MPAFMVSRARHRVRQADLALNPRPAGLPSWAVTPLPDADVELAQAWAGAASWPEAVAVVRGATAVVTGSTIRPSLDVLVTLYPGVDGLPSLVQLVEAIAEQGLERVLSQLEEQHAVQRLVDAWIATSTWKDSFTYLKDHGDELRADAVQAMLGEAAKSGDATAQQHVAILRLAGALPIEQVAELVTDAAVVTETALAALEQVDVPGG